MTPKRELEKVTMNFFAGQFAKLRALHPQVAPSEAVRQLVDQHIQRIEKRIPARAVPQEEIDLP